MPLTIGVDGSALSGNLTGVGNYILALLRALIATDSQASFIVYSNGPVAVGSLPRTETKISSPQGRRGAYWHNTQLARAIAQDRPDVFWGGNGLLPLIVPRKVRTVLTVHDLVYKYASATLPPVSRWSRALVQPISSVLATKVVAVSHATADQVLESYKRRVDDVIPPLLDPAFAPATADEVQRVRTKYALPVDYLICIGTLEPRKNLHALFRAIWSIRDRGQVLPRLALVGRSGWLMGNLEQEIARLEQAGAAQQMGYVPLSDMPALYTGARAFVMPSLYEGFGMPVLEAQLCGTPVMISDIPSLTEASGGFGMRFAPTVEGIERALAEAASSNFQLPRRPLDSIMNSPADAGQRMWDVISEAVGGDTRRCPSRHPPQ